MQRMWNKLGRQGALSLLPVLLVICNEYVRLQHSFIVPSPDVNAITILGTNGDAVNSIVRLLTEFVNVSCHCVSL